MLMRSLNALVARLSRPVRRSRRSISKSARHAILSVPESRSSWTQHGGLKDSPENMQKDNNNHKNKMLRESMLSLRYIRHLALTATQWALGSSNEEILVGGQAVIEGVMMRSPKGYSVAVRRQDGN